MLNKLQHKLFQVCPIQKNVLYNILKVLRNPFRESTKIFIKKNTFVVIIHIQISVFKQCCSTIIEPIGIRLFYNSWINDLTMIIYKKKVR